MLEQLRRDVTMLVRGLAGRTPPPLVKRMERRAAPARGVAVRTVVIEAVTRETADAVSVTLRDPRGAELAFTPGQFFTIEAAPPLRPQVGQRRGGGDPVEPRAVAGLAAEPLAVAVGQQQRLLRHVPRVLLAHDATGDGAHEPSI